MEPAIKLFALVFMALASPPAMRPCGWSSNTSSSLSSSSVSSLSSVSSSSSVAECDRLADHASSLASTEPWPVVYPLAYESGLTSAEPDVVEPGSPAATMQLADITCLPEGSLTRYNSARFKGGWGESEYEKALMERTADAPPIPGPGRWDDNDKKRTMWIEVLWPTEPGMRGPRYSRTWFGLIKEEHDERVAGALHNKTLLKKANSPCERSLHWFCYRTFIQTRETMQEKLAREKLAREAQEAARHTRSVRQYPRHNRNRLRTQAPTGQTPSSSSSNWQQAPGLQAPWPEWHQQVPWPQPPWPHKLLHRVFGFGEEVVIYPVAYEC